MQHLDIHRFADEMRRKILDMSFNSNQSTHLGGGLSIVEILAVLYGRILNFDHSDPSWEGRDRFILSKGHGVLGYYSALYIAKIINEEVCSTFLTNGTDLIAHPVMNMALGIESSNGSLGQGLSMGVGIALAGKKQQKSYRVYVLIGDGECNEGSIWEAVMSAAQLKLDNLVVVVDCNRLQSDGESSEIIDLGDISQKFRSFGWHSISMDGHDISGMVVQFEKNFIPNKPFALIANTIKGKGISFMEGNNEWHHNRLTKSNYELAVSELHQGAGISIGLNHG